MDGRDEGWVMYSVRGGAVCGGVRCTGGTGTGGAIVWLDMLQRLLNEWDDKITPLSVEAN